MDVFNLSSVKQKTNQSETSNQKLNNPPSFCFGTPVDFEISGSPVSFPHWLFLTPPQFLNLLEPLNRVIWLESFPGFKQPNDKWTFRARYFHANDETRYIYKIVCFWVLVSNVFFVIISIFLLWWNTHNIKLTILIIFKCTVHWY